MTSTLSHWMPKRLVSLYRLLIGAYLCLLNCCLLVLLKGFRRMLRTCKTCFLEFASDF